MSPRTPRILRRRGARARGEDPGQAERSRAAAAWQRAVDVPYDVSLRSARRLREQNPTKTPEALQRIAAARFVRRVGAESGAVGAVAAYPGAGTAVSAASSGVQLLSFVSEAAHYTLVAAHLHGIDLRDPAKRTALVLASLMGREGAEALSAQLGIQAVSWFRDSFIGIRTTAAQEFNRVMTAWLRRRALKKAASSTLTRLLPFGVGAVVGWSIGRSMANSVIEGAAIALGPAPLSFPEDPLVVDVRLEDSWAASRVPFDQLPLPDDVEGQGDTAGTHTGKPDADPRDPSSQEEK